MAVAVALGSRKHFQNLFPSPEGICQTDDAVETVFGKVNPCDFFSETYLEARSKFRQAAKDAGAELVSLQIYQNYTTDIAYLQSESTDLVVHTSGVHGIEGYAGSAVQIALLKNIPATKRPSVLLIHAVNPHGMAHYRRINENNVDLNRNGLHDFDKVNKRDPNMAGYVDFDASFNPTQPFRYGFFGELLPKLWEHGLNKLKSAMVSGQYHKATGIFYGGTQLEASNQKMYDFMKEFLETHPVKGKTTWINLHTGLGKSGMDTILLLDKNCKENVSQVFNESLVPGATGGDDVQDGYDMIQGATEGLMQPLLSQQDWIVTQEFGTKSSIWVGRALILENMQYNHLEKASKILRSAFYPRTPEWRQSILTRGLRVLQQAMER